MLRSSKKYVYNKWIDVFCTHMNFKNYSSIQQRQRKRTIFPKYDLWNFRKNDSSTQKNVL